MNETPTSISFLDLDQQNLAKDRQRRFLTKWVWNAAFIGGFCGYVASLYLQCLPMLVLTAGYLIFLSFSVSIPNQEER